MKKFQSTIIWLTATLFAIYELFITNGFYSVSLTLQQHDLSLPATATGTLAAISSLIYAIFQIPAGIMAGKYSIKIILAVATSFVAAGMLIYSNATGIDNLIIGRILVSIGSSFAFVSVAVLIGRWLPKEKFSLYFGLTQCLGNISVVSANMFLPQIITHLHGWRVTSTYLAIIGIILAKIILLIIKTSPKELHISENSSKNLNTKFGTQIISLLRNSQFWIVTLFAGLLLGSLFNFGANWLIGFQNNFDNNNLPHSALVSSIMFLGVALGNPIIGALSLKLKTRRLFLIIGSLISCIILAILVLGPTLNPVVAMIFYFTFGFSCSSAILSYSVIMEILPNEISGLGIGICNTVVYLCGAILSLAIGAIMHYQTELFASTLNYLFADKVSLSIFFVTMLQAFTVSLFIKESFK